MVPNLFFYQCAGRSGVAVVRSIGRGPSPATCPSHQSSPQKPKRIVSPTHSSAKSPCQERVIMRKSLPQTQPRGQDACEEAPETRSDYMHNSAPLST